MEPENNALLVRSGLLKRVSTDLKLALIGDAPYAADYISSGCCNTRDSRIVIPWRDLRQGISRSWVPIVSRTFVTEVGGTHPALIPKCHGCRGRADAGYLDTPENAEVAERRRTRRSRTIISPRFTRRYSSRAGKKMRESWRARRRKSVGPAIVGMLSPLPMKKLLKGLAGG